MSEEVKTPEQIADRKAAREKRMADRVAAYDAAFDVQQDSDEERLDELEEEHGYGRVLRINLKGWPHDKGIPTLMVFKLPTSREAAWTRYQQKVNADKIKPTDKVEISEQFAAACCIYPGKKNDRELYGKTLVVAPSILVNAANQLAELVRGRVEEEGK